MDSLVSGTVGVLTTAQSRRKALVKAADALKFIKRIVSESHLRAPVRLLHAAGLTQLQFALAVSLVVPGPRVV